MKQQKLSKEPSMTKEEKDLEQELKIPELYEHLEKDVFKKKEIDNLKRVFQSERAMVITEIIQ